MKSSTKIRVGIIGFGKRGILHASLSNMNPEAECKAICDTDKQLLTYMKIFYPQIYLFSDLELMLEKVSLDAVFICTPDNTHLSLASECIKKNLNIFVERPLAECFKSAKQMIKMTSKKNFIHSVGYYFPFKMTFQRAKSLIDNGVLDKIKRFRASLYYTLKTNKKKRLTFNKSQSEGGIATRTASSLFYLLYWLFGPMKSLYIKSTQKFAEAEESASLILDFSSGVMGLVDISWSRPGYPCATTTVTVEGTRGVMEVSDDFLKLYQYKKRGEFEKGWTTIHKSDLKSPSRFYLCDEGYFEGNSSFLKSCLDKKEPLITWNDGLEITRMVEAAYLSLHTNRVIYLNEVK